MAERAARGASRRRFDRLPRLPLRAELRFLIAAAARISCRERRRRIPGPTGEAGPDRGAFEVNPCDVDGIGDAVQRALSMSTTEQGIRMEALRARVFGFDVHRWAQSFLDELDRSGALFDGRVEATSGTDPRCTSPGITGPTTGWETIPMLRPFRPAWWLPNLQ